MTAKPSTHILVVDDQSGFRELLKRLLEPAGYEVRTASDAHDALASIDESPPAVAILDVHMPGPNGLWLANQIRARSPKTAMVLATSDTAVPPMESLRKGVVAYIIKPLQREAVLTAVSDAFNWFADESRVDLSRLGVPTAPMADPVEPRAASPAPPRTSGARWLRLAIRPIAVVAVVVAAAAITLYRQRTPTRAVELIAAGSGAVRVEDASGAVLTQGSGFFITPDTFVTNHHVIDGGSRATVSTAAGGLELQVRGLLAFDRQHDLALLKTTRPAASHLALNVVLPALGEEIFVYGAPRGLAGTLSQGIISAHREEQDLIQISAPISPGSSGSPVVNAKGEVIGVVVGQRLDGQGLNFATAAAHVATLLSSAGDLRPLLAAGRGAGNDLERYQLIGPVKTLTVLGSVPTTLTFDRLGRVVEMRPGDGVTKTLFEYDELGRLKMQVDFQGERPSKQWDFTPAGPNVVEATADHPRGPIRRRVEYAEDGTLVSDRTIVGSQVIASTRWHYDERAWPTPIRDGGPGDQTGAGSTSRDEHDALGNVVRRAADDGSALTVSHTFDARGNWTMRETTRVERDGARSVVDRERRHIEYWDR